MLVKLETFLKTEISTLVELSFFDSIFIASSQLKQLLSALATILSASISPYKINLAISPF